MHFSNSHYNQSSSLNFSAVSPKLVSIVLTTYNGENFLKQQIDSLIEQTYPNIEIIAMDDGSKDNTVTILNEYAARHSNINVIQNEVNLGFIKNFEKGCALSNGHFIAFSDQDDVWDLGKIKKMVEAIGDYPMIYADSMVCDENLKPTGKKISDITLCKDYSSCLEYAIFARIYGHALFFRKSFYEKINPFPDIIPHDWWLAYNATLQGGFKFLPEVLVYYRQHSSNLYGIVGGIKGNAGKTTKKDVKPNLIVENKRDKSEEIKIEREKIRSRVRLFYNICPDEFVTEKKVLKDIVATYEKFSLRNNFKRMFIFFHYHKLLLAVKKRSLLRQYLFCLKMFTTIK